MTIEKMGASVKDMCQCSYSRKSRDVCLLHLDMVRNEMRKKVSSLLDNDEAMEEDKVLTEQDIPNPQPIQSSIITRNRIKNPIVQSYNQNGLEKQIQSND